MEIFSSRAFLIRRQVRTGFNLSKILAAHLTLLFQLQFRPTSTTSLTSWIRWALVLRIKCPPLRCPVPRPGGVVVLQCLQRPVQDMTLVQRLLLPVLQALQVLVRPGFQSHATDDTLASTGISGVFLVNDLLQEVSVLTPATLVHAVVLQGVPVSNANHVCGTRSNTLIPQ